MTFQLTRGLTQAERKSINDDAIARGYYRDDWRIFKPGWGWYEPWYWSPRLAAKLRITNWEQYREKYELHSSGHQPMYGGYLLSRFYWEDWAKIRPPICVVLPNGEQWEMDRKSSNGEGWKVTGVWPNITCTPSIAAGGYHGFLQDGKFTPDCERPNDPNGIRPYRTTWRRYNPEAEYEYDTVEGNPPADYRDPNPKLNRNTATDEDCN